jgi:hypothetical protein
MPDHPIRNCLGCGQQDDHPRHHVVLQDGSSALWHNDCHSRASGCPECTAVVNSAGGAQGDELRAHIVEHDPVAAAGLSQGVING